MRSDVSEVCEDENVEHNGSASKMVSYLKTQATNTNDALYQLTWDRT
jgi:hypothetical protein